jgi:hypothetical protein
LQRWAKVLKPGLKKGQWTNEEDVRLTGMVQDGWKNWSVIAGEIPGRTSKQCRERWFHHLDPAINRSPYSEDEDALILSMHGSIGGRWAQIARALDARTGEAVKIRFKTLERHRRSGASGRCPQVTRRRSFVFVDENGKAVTANRSKRERQRTSKQMEGSKRPRQSPSVSPPVILSVPPYAVVPVQEDSMSSILDQLLMPGTITTTGMSTVGSTAAGTSDNAWAAVVNHIAVKKEEGKEEEAKLSGKKADSKELDWLVDMLLEIEHETGADQMSLDFADMHWANVDDQVSIDELLCLRDDEPTRILAGSSSFGFVGQPSASTDTADADGHAGAVAEAFESLSDCDTRDSLLV